MVSTFTILDTTNTWENIENEKKKKETRIETSGINSAYRNPLT